uniref:nitrate regulatory gene2 protein-like n=1 Tax=Erigeron canadensis TaxID=72917 RepID=UPI001CB95C0B|nr:nitrate regulatory gene2 protein-like [Erigeron canadensis]
MGYALSRFVDEQLDIPPNSSRSDSDLSSDFHGHDNGHLHGRGPMPIPPYDQPVMPYQQQPRPWELTDPYVLQYRPPPPFWGIMYQENFVSNYNNKYSYNNNGGNPVSKNQYAYYLKKTASATRTTVIQPEETRGWVEDAYDNTEYMFKYGYDDDDESSLGTSSPYSRMREEGFPEWEEELTETESHTCSTRRIILCDEHNEGNSSSSWSSFSKRIPTYGKRQRSMDDEGKKPKTFDIDDVGYSTTQKIDESSMPFAHAASRDLHEVFNEIKDEFEAAFSYGEQVALMLEAGKLPYQSKSHVLKVMLSKILYPSSTFSSSRSRVTKLAGSYDVYDVPDNRSLNPSSTLEKLYMWEKKLYQEVKDGERLRVKYQRMFRRLTELEPCRANSSRIDAARASIDRLITKLDISMKDIDAISSEIHKVRDMELEPQVSELIYGLIRMWQSVVKCHQKQLEAIMESRSWTLRANTNMERDSSLRTTLELETGLVTWAQHLNNWINAQKSFVDSLNGWLLQCIDNEPEITIDGGEVPYSPDWLGAPPIFIICNDWQWEINGVSQEQVSIAMNNFAMILRQLLERQVDLDSKKAMRLVKNVGSDSLQGGLIPIFKALENFCHDILKAHKHVKV